MRTFPSNHAALSVAATFMLIGVGGVSGTPITRGFVSETPREFEYNSGFMNSGEHVTDAFSVFGAYPGLFDLIGTDYFPEWENDALVVIGTFYFNSFYRSGDQISGSGQFFDFGAHPALTVTATFENAILNTSIGNVNVRGYYSGRIESEHRVAAVRVPDTGSTLALLSGSLVLGMVARKCRGRNGNRV